VAWWWGRFAQFLQRWPYAFRISVGIPDNHGDGFTAVGGPFGMILQTAVFLNFGCSIFQEVAC
jgi:hypothetical protein